MQRETRETLLGIIETLWRVDLALLIVSLGLILQPYFLVGDC